MTNIKGLKEKKEAIKLEVRAMFDKAGVEARGFNEVEEEAYDAKMKEIRSLDETIQRQESFATANPVVEIAKVADEVSDEEKEKRSFTQFLQQREGAELAEYRSVVTTTEPGKLLVPVTISDTIVELLDEEAPLFAGSRNFTTTTGVLEILRETDLGTAGFIGEMVAATPNDFKMDKVTLRQHRAVTAIQLSQHMINDSAIDISSYSTKLLGRRLGRTLDHGVLLGKGNTADNFEGILLNKKIEKVAMAGDNPTIIELQELMNSMNPYYVKGAVWVVGRKQFTKIASLQDGNGNFYMMTNVVTDGQPYSLFGLPIFISDSMEDEANTDVKVLLVNLQEGYATMTKKGLELKHVSADTTQALQGGHLFLLDGYFDGVVLNEKAIRFLTKKA